jgi:transcriptional regulator with XRE-family HTH domain
MNNEIFGKQLKYIREKRNVKAEQLAEILNIDVRSVWQIESGRRSTTINNLIKICNYLKVKPEFLISEIDISQIEKENDTAKLSHLIEKMTPGELNHLHDISTLILNNRGRYW